MATGSAGDPLIIGTYNNSESAVTAWEVTHGSLYLYTEGGTSPPLRIVASDSTEAPGLVLSADTVGVDLQAPTAIQADGAVEFSSAGLATIASGKSSVVISPGVDITSATKVLVTAQSGGGTVQRVARNVTADSFQIVLKAAATQQMTVAYFVIS